MILPVHVFAFLHAEKSWDQPVPFILCACAILSLCFYVPYKLWAPQSRDDDSLCICRSVGVLWVVLQQYLLQVFLLGLNALKRQNSRNNTLLSLLENTRTLQIWVSRVNPTFPAGLLCQFYTFSLWKSSAGSQCQEDTGWVGAAQNLNCLQCKSSFHALLI